MSQRGVGVPSLRVLGDPCTPVAHPPVIQETQGCSCAPPGPPKTPGGDPDLVVVDEVEVLERGDDVLLLDAGDLADLTGGGLGRWAGFRGV